MRSPDWQTIYLGLGSNLGDRALHLDKGIGMLRQKGIELLRTSSLWESEAVGPVSQPDFMNLVVETRSSWPAQQILQVLQAIETASGRSADSHDRPRTLDIDLLYYGRLIIRTPALTIPHPRIALRRFVLLPMTELVPEFVDPLLRRSLQELLRESLDTHWIRRVRERL